AVAEPAAAVGNTGPIGTADDIHGVTEEAVAETPPVPPVVAAPPGTHASPVSFEAILETKPITAPQVTVVAICAILYLINGFCVAAGVGLMLAASSLGVPMSSLSVAFTALAIGAVLGAAAGGVASDRFGRKPILIAAAGVVAVSTVLCGAATVVAALITLR